MNYNRVYVCEKNELVNALVAALDSGFKKEGQYYTNGTDAIVGCVGHMLKIAPPESHDENLKKWSLESLPFYFPNLKYETEKSKSVRLKAIYDLMYKAKTIVHVGDPDDEGQLIIDELIRAKKINKPVLRLLINDNNVDIVRRELSRMEDNKKFEHLGYQASARGRADYFYGLNFTRLFTLLAQNYNGVLSVGRVQTAIFTIIFIREQQFYNFVPSDFYKIYAIADISNHAIKFNYINRPVDSIDESKRLINLEEVKAICTNLSNFKNGKVLNKEVNVKKTPPPLPYNIIVLQSDCYKMFEYSPKQVKDITQSLREKYRAITYNRSDCQYLNDEHFADAKGVLNQIATNLPSTAKIVAATDSNIKSRAFNSKKTSAHHAIIPTMNNVDTSSFTEQELNVYKIICRNYLIQFLPPLEEEVTKVTISIGEYSFSATSTRVIQAGFTTIYKSGATREKEETTDSDDTSNDDLSMVQIGDTLQIGKTGYDIRQTAPLPLYKMNTLLDDLPVFAKYVKDPALKQLLIERDKDKKGEHGGIGTPATRDEIIDILFTRKMVEFQRKNIVTTDVGKQFYAMLPDEVKDLDLTALWYSDQRNINSADDVEKFVENVYSKVAEICNKFKNETVTFSVSSDDKAGATTGKKSKTKAKGQGSSGNRGKVLDMDCPTCAKGKLRRIENKAKKQFFYGCTNFPECKATFPEFDKKPYIKGNN
ncbi:MAG: DNA topoisomerase [Sedimentibacter sp.]